MNKKSQTISLKTPFITLGQLLKLANVIQTGGEVKSFLASNIVKVNGIDENRRGRKLYKNDIVDLDSDEILLK